MACECRAQGWAQKVVKCPECRSLIAIGREVMRRKDEFSLVTSWLTTDGSLKNDYLDIIIESAEKAGKEKG